MYTTKSKIENYLMVDIDESFDEQIVDWISAAELYINNYTQVVVGFDSPDAGTVRYYDGNGKREIIIDECTSIDSVEILELDGTDTEWTLTEGKGNDFLTYPLNDTPIYKLELVIGSQVGQFYKGQKRIKITAKWGHSTSVPKDIELAATILVAGIVEQGLKGGKIASETLGDYSVSFEQIEDSPQMLGVMKILNKYRVYEL